MNIRAIRRAWIGAVEPKPVSMRAEDLTKDFVQKTLEVVKKDPTGQLWINLKDPKSTLTLVSRVGKHNCPIRIKRIYFFSDRILLLVTGQQSDSIAKKWARVFTDILVPNSEGYLPPELKLYWARKEEL